MEFIILIAIAIFLVVLTLLIATIYYRKTRNLDKKIQFFHQEKDSMYLKTNSENWRSK